MEDLIKSLCRGDGYGDGKCIGTRESNDKGTGVGSGDVSNGGGYKDGSGCGSGDVYSGGNRFGTGIGFGSGYGMCTVSGYGIGFSKYVMDLAISRGYHPAVRKLN